MSELKLLSVVVLHCNSELIHSVFPICYYSVIFSGFTVYFRYRFTMQFSLDLHCNSQQICSVFSQGFYTVISSGLYSVIPNGFTVYFLGVLQCNSQAFYTVILSGLGDDCLQSITYVLLHSFCIVSSTTITHCHATTSNPNHYTEQIKCIFAL